MNRSFWGTVLLMLAIAVPAPAMAEVNVNVGIALPPPILFPAPPALIVLPETYVYIVPDVDDDLFFYNGWWWRPWEGRWYRSRYYGSGWVFYQRVPFFYSRIPSGWRNDYRDHRWQGRQWNYERIPHQELQRNWRTWERDRHWEKQQTWGVQGLRPRTRSQDRSQAVRPGSQPKPQVRKETGPQPSRQRSEVRRRRPDPQRGEAQQQTEPRQGKHQRNEEERQQERR
jgi:hypothetical protein